MIVAAVDVPFWAWVIIVPAGLLAAFCLLLFVVALWEKTPVVQFHDEPITQEDSAELPAYVLAMNHATAQRGFTYGGTYRHVKHAALYCSYWLSPDRRTLARVAGGTIARMPSKTTALTSELADGRLVATRDEVMGIELSGLIDIHVQVHGDFDELWAVHWSRVQPVLSAVWTPQPSTLPRDIDREWDRRQAEVMVMRGRARWTDASKSAFRYTLAGALRIVVVQFLGQLFKHASTGGAGFSRPRPGDQTASAGFPVHPPAQPVPWATDASAQPARPDKQGPPAVPEQRWT